MESLKEFMSRRYFGIPVGVFALIAAAVILFFALRMRSTTTPTDEAVTTDEAGGDADPFGDTENPTFSASPTVGTVVAVPQTDTNELWATRARNWLVSQGMSPTDAQSLVYKYLNSQSLTATEATKINACLIAIGYPPEPPDPVTQDDPTDTDTDNPSTEPSDDKLPTTGGGTGNSTPPTKQGTPPCMHTIKSARDNGPGELAILYFGNNNPATVNKIEAANLDKGPGPWGVGTKIKIPANVEPAYFTCTQNVRGLNEIAAKNGVSKEYIRALNPGMDFPRPVGSRVRVR